MAVAFTSGYTFKTGEDVSKDILPKKLGAAFSSASITMATGFLLGRNTAGTGAVEEITLGTGLSFTGTTLNASGGGSGTVNVGVAGQMAWYASNGSAVSGNANVGYASGTLSVASGSLTVSAPSISLSQTWNNGAIPFVGMQLSVTDTASAATSVLQRLNSGSSKFDVGLGTASGANRNIYGYLSGVTGVGNGPGWFTDIVGDTESRAVLSINTIYTGSPASATGQGELSFGPGSAARDWFLYRSSAKFVSISGSNTNRSVVGGFAGPVNWGDGTNFLGRLTYTAVAGDPAIAAGSGKGFSIYVNDAVSGPEFVISSAGVWTVGGTNKDVPISPTGTGSVRIGTKAGSTPYAGIFSIYGNSADTTYFTTHYSAADANASGMSMGKSRGSVASPAACNSGDTLGGYYAGGFGNVWNEYSAGLIFQTSQAWSSGNNGTQLQLAVTPNGSTTRTVAVTIANNGAVTLASSLTTSQTGGIVGTTTNNNANAGSVGEFVESIVPIASEVTLTSAATSDVTSISLTAGDWDVCGIVYFDPGASTVYNVVLGGVSTTSATAPSRDTGNQGILKGPTAGFDTANNLGLVLPQVRLSLSGTTTTYLTCNSTFTISTLKAYGAIRARRRR